MEIEISIILPEMRIGGEEKAKKITESVYFRLRAQGKLPSRKPQLIEI